MLGDAMISIELEFKAISNGPGQLTASKFGLRNTGTSVKKLNDIRKILEGNSIRFYTYKLNADVPYCFISCYTYLIHLHLIY